METILTDTSNTSCTLLMGFELTLTAHTATNKQTIVFMFIILVSLENLEKKIPRRKLNFHLPTGCIKLNCNLLYFVGNSKRSLINGWTYYPWQGICGKKNWLQNSMLVYAKTSPIRTNFLFLLRNSLRLPRKKCAQNYELFTSPHPPPTKKILPWVEIPILKSAFFF